ncbi:ATP-binding protein, partial [Flavihumibacter sediminis]|nr:ATP-binding protein [Flavihumibacter sediminis]
TDIVVQVDAMLDYIKRRASGKIRFEFMAPPTGSLIIPLSATLFDWVIENLLKNALDAMEGQGQITVHIQDNEREVLIDVTDTGKGIPASHISRVFDPGFTTKKRG